MGWPSFPVSAFTGVVSFGGDDGLGVVSFGGVDGLSEDDCLGEDDGLGEDERPLSFDNTLRILMNWRLM